MDFQNLPDGWAQRPITDPEILEGVIDLIVTEASRAVGALYLLLCHADGRLLQPVAVDGFPAGCPAGLVQTRFGALFGDLVDRGVPGVVLAVARWGQPELSVRDHEWRTALTEAAEAAGLAVLGAAVAVPGAILTFPPAVVRRPLSA